MDDSRAVLTFWISVAITAVWIISFFVDIFVQGYEPPPSVHALMLIVAGALFSEGRFRKKNGAESPPPPVAPQEETSTP